MDRRAGIADDVEIGPFCVISGDVQIGSGCRLIANVHLVGPLVIGTGNTLYPFVCLGMEPQNRRSKPDDPSGGVVIGNNNMLREGVSIHRATTMSPTRIGDDNYLMAYSHIGHDSVMGNGCTLANSALIAGHVHISDKATLGGNAAVHQFCRLGRLSMTSGVTAIVQDLPPFCTSYNQRRVSSLNLVGLRRAGYQPHIDNLKEVFNIIFRRGHTNPQTIAQIERRFAHDPLCMEMAQFIRTTSRGIMPYGSSTDIADIITEEPARPPG